MDPSQLPDSASECSGSSTSEGTAYDFEAQFRVDVPSTQQTLTGMAPTLMYGHRDIFQPDFKQDGGGSMYDPDLAGPLHTDHGPTLVRVPSPEDILKNLAQSHERHVSGLAELGLRLEEPDFWKIKDERWVSTVDCSEQSMKPRPEVWDTLGLP